MLQHIRRSAARRDGGYTLAELGVIIVILGVLAAVALPVLIGQRTKAVDSSLKSDLKGAGSAVTSWFVDNPLGGPAMDYNTNAKMMTTFAGYGYRPSPNNSVWMLYKGGNSFCIFAFNPGATTAKTLATSLVYDSLAGGLIARSAVPPTGACAA